MRIGFFTECYKPIVNGVVASIDALRDGLCAHGVDVTTIAPHFPHFVDDALDVVRIPSLPLPTQTAYRLCVPYLNAVDRRRVRGIELVHAHSPFVTGWMAVSYARRHRIPLVFTYHTRLDAYAHYAPFDRATTERAMMELTRRYANAADAVVVPTLEKLQKEGEIGRRFRRCSTFRKFEQHRDVFGGGDLTHDATAQLRPVSGSDLLQFAEAEHNQPVGFEAGRRDQIEDFPLLALEPFGARGAGNEVPGGLESPPGESAGVQIFVCEDHKRPAGVRGPSRGAQDGDGRPERTVRRLARLLTDEAGFGMIRRSPSRAHGACRRASL